MYHIPPDGGWRSEETPAQIVEMTILVVLRSAPGSTHQEGRGDPGSSAAGARGGRCARRHFRLASIAPAPQRFEWLSVLPNFQRLQSNRWAIHGHRQIEFQANTPPDRGVFASDLTRPSPAFYEVMSR